MIMCDQRKPFITLSTPTPSPRNASFSIVKFLLFTSQVFFVCLLTFGNAAADGPPGLPGLIHHRRDERPIPKYKYSYTVRGAEGGQHGHQVYRDGSYTQGKYFVKLNGGTGQNVEYYTDHFGYHPKVVYMNHLATGSSGARISYGRAAIPFETSVKNYTITEPPTKENYSTSVQQNITETTAPSTEPTPYQSYGTSAFSDHHRYPSTSSPDEKSTTFASTTPSYSAEDILRDTVYNQPQTIDTIAPILLAHPSPEDTYLQPELNEISNGFVGNIVSMLPGILASRTKLLKPIIVSNSSTAKREISSNDTITADLDAHTAESEHPEEYHEIPDEQAVSPNDTDIVELDEKTQTKYAEVDIKKPQVDVVIEPQMLEEQAVITTTVDIAKSLPLAVNFVPETDNHLNDLPLNLVPTQPQVVLPQHNVYLQPPAEQPVVALQLPQAVLKPDNIPQPYLLPNSEFHYIPIPVLQHQPNLIPLNYINDNKTTSDLPEQNHDSIRPPSEQQPLDNVPKTEYTFVKSIEEYAPNPYKSYDAPRKQYKPHAQIDLRRPSAPYTTINLPAAHLVPYVKHNFLQPSAHSPQQKLPPPNASPKSHTIPYNIKSYPKEKRAPQKAPFKPSHPVWDSVYPPSHMYYVPLVVVDRIPGERNPKDSFTRRHHHLRRLYVEYGGFKPPLVPSTLIESEEPAQEKRDVPKEAGSES